MQDAFSDLPDYTTSAESLMAAEASWIRERRALYMPERRAGDGGDFVGLALSGGGIRSAIFGLGVMQALAKHGVMRRIDYLSTVSGGGYIGSSLTWLLSAYGRAAERGDGAGFSLDADDFPFGTRDRRTDADERALPRGGGCESPRNIIRWLRQHGSYLTPGDGLNTMALVAVVLRGAVLSVLVYASLITLLMLAASALGLLACCAVEATAWERLPAVLRAAVWVAGALGLAAVLYSIASRFTRKHALQALSGLGLAGARRNAYRVRRGLERYAGTGLTLALVLAVVGTVPLVHEALGARLERAGLAAAASAVLGMLSSLALFRGGGGTPRVPPSLVATVGAALLIYGLLLGGFALADWLLDPPGTRAAAGVPALVFLVVVVGLVTNTNCVSVHRYYRDRLMETFMPDLPVDTGRGIRGATGADRQMIQDVANRHAPYHLINANVVLVHSGVPKFRGRGGDAFVFSPAYTGSAATGWVRSDDFMGGSMSLPGAMAVSGAAAHPNTGVGGEGLTRGCFVAFLMAFMNVRLGLWARNPDRGKGVKWLPEFVANVPDFIYPGLRELLSYHIDEHGRHVLLTDGGHFENLGIYELTRRRCKVIIACDAAADPEFAFSDLANAVERVRADFGVKINLTLEHLQPLVPRARENAPGRTATFDVRETYAHRGYVVAPIEYPATATAPATTGWLVYIKTTFTNAVSADLYGYRRAHPSYPDQTTGDQFFDERQFEAYRELGFQTANEMLDKRRWKDGFPEPDAQPERTLFGNGELAACLGVGAPA
jgi:predicted acylesterase/phospholipase RssA